MSSIPLRYRRILELATRLGEATAHGKVEWAAIPNPALAEKSKSEEGKAPTAFEYRRQAGTVQIMSRDGDDSAPYLMVLRRNKKAIDEVQSEWWGDDGDYAAPWNDALNDLYSLARGAALGVDSTVDALLSELHDDDIPF